MLESKELDDDGRLSFEEFMGEPSRAEKLFKLMDKDGDGFVTKNVRKGIFFKDQRLEENKRMGTSFSSMQFL